MRRALLTLPLLLAMVMTALGAGASPDPIHVTGDSFVVDEAKQLATFTGNVVLERRALTLWAGEVVAAYGAGGPSDITSFTATGRVRIKTPQQEATGDRAIYNPNTRMLRLTGNVMVINKMGTVGSADLVVNLATNTSVFTSGKGGRVSGVFTPK